MNSNAGRFADRVIRRRIVTSLQRDLFNEMARMECKKLFIGFEENPELGRFPTCSAPNSAGIRATKLSQADTQLFFILAFVYVCVCVYICILLFVVTKPKPLHKDRKT